MVEENSQPALPDPADKGFALYTYLLASARFAGDVFCGLEGVFVCPVAEGLVGYAGLFASEMFSGDVTCGGVNPSPASVGNVSLS